MKISAFIGVIGSGKDHRANKLRDEQGYARLDFKDALLDMCSDVAGYDVREDYEWFKESVVGVRKPSNRFMEMIDRSLLRDLRTRNPDILTGRRLLTRLGTDTMRKRDSSYWVDQFLAKLDQLETAGRDIAVADCRFSNEVRTLIGMGAEFTFCDFRSPRYNPKLNHASEKLAQRLLRAEYEDGEILSHVDLMRITEVME